MEVVDSGRAGDLLGSGARAEPAREGAGATAAALAVAVLAFAACTFSPFGSLPENLPGRFSVAVSLACLGFGWKPRIPEAVREAATLTFGVYLVHPLVAKLLGTAFDVWSWTRFEHAALVWLGAASIVLALRRVRITWHECAFPRVA